MRMARRKSGRNVGDIGLLAVNMAGDFNAQPRLSNALSCAVVKEDDTGGPAIFVAGEQGTVLR